MHPCEFCGLWKPAEQVHVVLLTDGTKWMMCDVCIREECQPVMAVIKNN